MIKISENMRPKWATLSNDIRIRPQDKVQKKLHSGTPKI